MTILDTTRLCLLAALVYNSSAFTVGTPVTIDVPVVPGIHEHVSASSVSSASKVLVSSSNLPPQSDLLDRIGSFTVSASSTAAPPKASSSEAVSKSGTAAPPKASSSEAASKAGTVRISDIFYDGKVPRTESDEYVVLQNSSKSVIDVSGYSLYPATTGTQGSTFTFPKGSTIQPNSSVRIYTNEIHKETGGYSWGSGKALWSNSGGLAVLNDANGKKLGEFKYVPSASKKS